MTRSGPSRVPDRAAGIDRLAAAVPSSGPPILWKYHQGTPFCMVTTAVSCAEQRRDLVERRPDRMGFQRQHDIVLHAELVAPARRP